MLRITSLLFFVCAVPAHSEEYRTWRDASGKYSSEARFDRLDVESRSVCLTTKAGKKVHVAFSKLRIEDQNYVLEADARRQDAPTIGQLELVTLAPSVIDVFRKKKFPLPRHRRGLLVNDVPSGSPASTGGLHGVDIIYAIDDTPIQTIEDYVWATRSMKIGQPYKILVERISDEEPPSKPSPKPRTPHNPSNQAKKSTASKARWEEKVLTVVPLSMAEVTKAMKNAPPLKLAGGILENSIGVPIVEIGGRNLTDKAITAFVVELQCFDRFEKPVLGFGGTKSNKVPAIYQETIKAKSAFVGADDIRVTLNGYETATVVKIYLKKVKFDDGSEWSSDEGVYMDTAKSSK
jgi:hypothetical protein